MYIRINSLAFIFGALAIQSLLLVYTVHVQTSNEVFPQNPMFPRNAFEATQQQQQQALQGIPIHNKNSNNNKNNNAVMVLATVPLDERHLVSLWTELECFTGSVSHVVLSSAYWAKPILETVVREAQTQIPHFRSSRVAIEARYFDNERYDVGLWCDGLQGFTQQTQGQVQGQAQGMMQSGFDKFLLLNDSVFALRTFNGILQDLESSNPNSTNNTSVVVAMNSLNYIQDDQGDYWYESVFRGFNHYGITVFMNHSCVPQTHKSFCRILDPRRKVAEYRKRCIVKYHEVALAQKFKGSSSSSPQPHQDGSLVQPPPQTIRIAKGLYDGKVPDKKLYDETAGQQQQQQHNNKRNQWLTWVQNPEYWSETLVKEQNFPAAKVNQLGMIGSNLTTDPLLATCTRYLPQNLLESIDFGVAEHVRRSRRTNERKDDSTPD